MKFKIGAPNTTVDLPTLVDTRALIQGNSGGGKSWLLRLIAERTCGKCHVIILDPEGEFGTLREKFDFALIGQGGEVAAETRTAGLLARRLVEYNLSAIIDLYALELSQKRVFVRIFLESLLSVPRQQWHPLLVMLDECHKMCPEKGEVESTRAVINLMDSGRKRGFCGIIATQRLSKLHKDAAAEANNVFIGRTWLDLDQERAGDLLGMRKADRSVLRDLKPGEFYAFGPSLSTKGVFNFVSDQVITTHPTPGQRHIQVAPKASDAIQKIVKQIGDLPQQAEEEVTVAQASQKRIVELERELRARPVQVQPKVEQVRVEVPVISQEQITDLKSLSGEFLQVIDGVRDAVSKLSLSLASLNGHSRRPFPAPPISEYERQAVKTQAMPNPGTRTDTGTFVLGERRILSALLRYPNGKSKIELAVVSGYKHRGGAFNNYLGRLKSANYITGSKDLFRLTDTGQRVAVAFGNDLPEDIIAYWKEHLSKCERAIFTYLVDQYPNAFTKEHIAGSTLPVYDPGGGGFSNALSRVKVLEIVDKEGAYYRASEKVMMA